MKAPFVPEAFAVPLLIKQEHFVLRPLTTAEVDKDYETVMSSRVSLRIISVKMINGPLIP